MNPLSIHRATLSCKPGSDGVGGSSASASASPSHLGLISQGKRVPSVKVVEAMKAMPFEAGEYERLHKAAVRGRGRDLASR